MPRLLLCSPAAEGSRAAQLLQQRGLQLKVSNSTTADLVLPVRGGSLSFLLFGEAEGNQELVDRASLAARASRRTTVLWTGAIDHDTVDETALALQNAWCSRARVPTCCAQPGSTAPISPPRPSSLPRWTPSPAGVTVLRCERHEEVADHVLACEQRAAEDGAASAAQLMPDEVDDVTEGVHAHLGEVWGADKHHVRPRERPVRSPKPRWLRKRAPAPLSCAQIAFLLATKPLAALARVRNEEDWHALLYETKVCPHHTGPRSLPTPSHAARASARALSTQSCSTLRSTGCSETGHSSERARRVRGRGFGPW